MTASAFFAASQADLMLAPRRAGRSSPAAHAARTVFSAPRLKLWAAFAAALFALTLPDCCLSGRHAAGFGMELYGSICHAAR